MKIFRFDAEVGRDIHQFDSRSFIMSRIIAAQQSGQFHIGHIGCAYLGPNGVIGQHETVSEQLLLVVQGEGFASGEDFDKVPIRSGHAVFWGKGELHETSTEHGLIGLIIEGESLRDALMMPELGG
jgi:hypothetical protein